MTKADTSVKWFRSEMADAPVLRGQPGALIEVLDACLVNGFCVRTPDAFSVADGVATLTFGGGNPYEKHAVITITGASVAGLNAEWRIATSAASSFTFACPGVADGVVTGAAVKRAAAGWEKPFADGGAYKATYRPIDPFSTRNALRILDSNAQWVRPRGYESITDVDTGINPFPTFGQATEANLVWPKSSTSNATPRSWVIVGDGSFFYYIPTWHSSYEWEDFFCFGDLEPLYSADIYCSYLGAAAASTVSWPNQALTFAISIGPAGSTPRSISGAYNPAAPYVIHANGIGATSSTAALMTDTPVFTPVFGGLTQSAAEGIRSTFPGLLSTAAHPNISMRKSVVDIDGLPAILLHAAQSGALVAQRMRTVAVLLDGWRR